MSALNFIQTGDAIHLFADAAGYDDNGVLCDISEKLSIRPSAGAVIGVIGDYRAIQAFNTCLHGSSLGDLVREAPGLAQEMIRHAKQAGAPGRGFKLIVAGFAANGSREVWEMNCHPEALLPPSILLHGDCEWNFSPAAPREIVGPALQEGLNLRDPEQLALNVLEYQRCTPIVVPGWNHDRETHVVGGFAQMVTVRKDAITSKILRRWPDSVGAPIDPKFN